jgi:RNA 2',3'-cyclic 3'-phosphodiesterase
MRARNPLYVMAKPPPEVQVQIAALPRNDPGRGPDLLYVTLISLYDLHTAPPEWLPATPKNSWRRAGQLRRAAFHARLRPDREPQGGDAAHARAAGRGAGVPEGAGQPSACQEKAPIMDGGV